MQTLYSMALTSLRPAAEVWAWMRGRDPDRRLEAAQRRGLDYPLVESGSVWLHGASVGEARLVEALAAGLGPGTKVFSTAVTPAGHEMLEAGRRPVAFAPLDLPAYVRRAFDSVRPALLGIVETELWPNLLREAERRAVPAVLLNARIAAGKMRRYRRFAALYAPRLRGLKAIAAQTEGDAARFVALGADERLVEVAGNIKFDLAPPDADRKAVREALGIASDRPVWVAGSTRKGEEQVLLEALRSLRASRPELLLVLAPRHLERLGEVEDRIRNAGLDWTAYEQACSTGVRAASLLLVDRIGVLNRLYAAADFAFVGGTLVAVGGHNVLEPAAAGVPVLFGPYRANVEEPARQLIDSGAGHEVRDAAALAARIQAWLADSELRAAAAVAAAEVVRLHRGALERNLAVITRALASPGIEPA